MPDPAADEVLVRVRAVSVNHMDIDVAQGRGPGREVRLPHVPGIDPAGEVIRCGPAVDGLASGCRVVVKTNIACGSCRFCVAGEDENCLRHENVGVHRHGGFAEYLVVPARNVFPLPSAVSYEEASAFSHSVPVAMTMLRDVAGLVAADVVLVTGAAGAVGNAAVQVAKALGAGCIAATSSADKCRWIGSLGADHTIDYRATPEFGARARELAGEGGVTIYAESAGDPAVWEQGLASLGRRGRAVVCGTHAGGEVALDLRLLYRNRLRVLGSAGSSCRAFKDSLELVADGAIRVQVDRTFRLEEAQEAFRVVLERRNRGKVVLVVG